MVSLERIVRPFQSKDVTPPQRIFNPSETPVDNVRIVCGQAGSTKTFNSSYSSTVTSYVETKHRELTRETSIKRITNPDDETQYVDVELIDKLKLSGVNGQEASFTYKNKSDGDRSSMAPRSARDYCRGRLGRDAHRDAGCFNRLCRP